MAPSFIPTEVVGRRRLDIRLAAVVSDHHSLKEAPHILDREPWREFVDGEAGDVRRRVLGLDLEHAGLVRPSARVRTRLVRERHPGCAVSTATAPGCAVSTATAPGCAVSTATAARSEDEQSKQHRPKTTL